MHNGLIKIIHAFLAIYAHRMHKYLKKDLRKCSTHQQLPYMVPYFD